jgi:hypothetical protein
MPLGFGEYLTLASYAMKGAGAIKRNQDAYTNDIDSIRNARAQTLLNNQLAERNQGLISEQRIATMRAHGFDKFEIAKQIRAGKAATIAQRGGSGSLSSGALNASLANIQRIGSEALRRKELNFGMKLRNLEIESQNVYIGARTANQAAFNKITSTQSNLGTGLQLAQIGVGAIKDLGFEKNETTGENEFKGFN